MVKSMTGYGRHESVLHGRTLVIEVKSVNNRYLDCNVRLPRVYICAEDGVQRRVKEVISRGKVDVYVNMENNTEEAVSVTLNQPVAAGYMEALRDFDAMRCREGEKLEADLLGRLDTLEDFTHQVEQRSPQTVADYRARLTAKLQEVLADRQLDESRVLTEAAIFADKVAVDEETVRLHSHIAQFRDMLAGGSPIGRKLDFLIQEMNRETNTIGSKCNNLEISTIVVNMKAEIEKIREQVQNIE